MLWATIQEQRSGEIQQGMKTSGPNISSMSASKGQSGLADLWLLGTFIPDQPWGKQQLSFCVDDTVYALSEERTVHADHPEKQGGPKWPAAQMGLGFVSCVPLSFTCPPFSCHSTLFEIHPMASALTKSYYWNMAGDVCADCLTLVIGIRRARGFGLESGEHSVFSMVHMQRTVTIIMIFIISFKKSFLTWTFLSVPLFCLEDLVQLGKQVPLSSPLLSPFKSQCQERKIFTEVSMTSKVNSKSKVDTSYQKQRLCASSEMKMRRSCALGKALGKSGRPQLMSCLGCVTPSRILPVSMQDSSL